MFRKFGYTVFVFGEEVFGRYLRFIVGVYVYCGSRFYIFGCDFWVFVGGMLLGLEVFGLFSGRGF